MKKHSAPGNFLAAATGLLLISPLSAFAQEASSLAHHMSWIQALLLGIVEGVTEYLPVSSTGHLTLANHLMGIDAGGNKEAADAYSICIQLGAIVAVLALYRRRFATMLMGIIGKDETGKKLAIGVVAAFLPAAIIGILFEDYIKRYLFGMWPVTAAWLVGGIVVLFIAGRVAPGNGKGKGLESLTLKSALIIGLFQCIAMWPGVSRSLATILGGIAVGLSAGAAVEFSFLLGLITLSAATMYDALKFGDTIIATFGIVNPLLGLAVAFVAAIISVRWMVSYLTRHSLAVFGWYRIALALAVGGALLYGIL